ncbi:MAG: MarC family protein [Dehalococcoidia bacterium]|jgi:multiple antibiotic resistance protein|nr:MarC family protein [Dehalococcoidia bacterium]
MWGDLARALVSFFAIIDPLGNVLVFHLLTQGMGARQKATVATAAVAAAFVLVVIFSLSGVEVLDFLGISPSSFQVAAGVLLVLPAYRMVERGEGIEVQGGKGEEAMLGIALVPLATPLLVGPGALAATVSFSQSMGPEVPVIGAGAVLAASWAAFMGSDLVFRLLGEAALRLLTRLVGILLMAIAVDFILEGASTFI